MMDSCPKIAMPRGIPKFPVLLIAEAMVIMERSFTSSKNILAKINPTTMVRSEKST